MIEVTSNDCAAETRERLQRVADQLTENLRQERIEKRVKEERAKVPFFMRDARAKFDPCVATINEIYDRLSKDLSTPTDSKTLITIAQEAIQDAMLFRQKFDLAITELLRLGIRTQDHYQGGITNYAGRLA
jgi:hypothetical protein